MKNLSAEIVAVGTELLLGDILNTNAQFLSKELSELGYNVFFQTVVGDNPARLTEAIHTAIKRADLVITSGGLGPTDDDLTKETVAKFFGLELETDDESERLIRKYFEKRDVFPKSNLKQAMIPKGAIAIKNDNGTAPGVLYEEGEKTVVMLPGPPFELMPMFKEKIRPILEKKTGSTILSNTLKVFGLGESQAAEMLGEILDSENPTVAPYAKQGEVVFRITAKAENEDKAKEKIEPIKEKIKKIFGDCVYAEGESSLAETVVSSLLEKELTVATAESCTGGLLSAAITDVSGASGVFKMGVVTYSNEAKEELLGVDKKILDTVGAVSSEVAISMAEGIKKRASADIGVGITGIAGPGGATIDKPVGLVWVGVASRHGSFAKALNIKGNRQKVRNYSVLNALDLIRKEAEKL